jgi:hypothetical protein
MGEGDAAELTLALSLAGVPHPPGYPLYTLLGAGWVHALHALGLNWAHAANLWSVAGAAVALGLTAALADRLIPRSVKLDRMTRAAVLGVMLVPMAAQPLFARAASQAEVYSWEVAWTAAAALTALGFHHRLRALPPLAPSRVALGALGWGLLVGAGLAHRPTTLAYAIPLTLILLVAAARARRLGPPALVAGVAGLALPIASYGWMLWRASHPAPFQWPLLEPGFESFLAHVSGSVYARYLGGFDPSDPAFPLFMRDLAPVLVLAAACGAWLAWHARHTADAAPLIALLAGALAQVAFLSRYGARDAAVYLLPALVPAVAMLAAAVGETLSRLRRPVPAAAALVAAATWLALAWLVPEFERGAAIAARDAEVRAAFRTLPFARGVVLWDSDSHARLRAHQLLDGDQRDLVVLSPAMLSWPAPRRAATRALGFDPLAGLELTSEADLARIAPHIAGRTDLPVVDFEAWWRDRPRSLAASERGR